MAFQCLIWLRKWTQIRLDDLYKDDRMSRSGSESVFLIIFALSALHSDSCFTFHFSWLHGFGIYLCGFVSAHSCVLLKWSFWWLVKFRNPQLVLVLVCHLNFGFPLHFFCCVLLSVRIFFSVVELFWTRGLNSLCESCIWTHILSVTLQTMTQEVYIKDKAEIFYVFLYLNKSHEKDKTKNFSLRLFILSDVRLH